MLLHAYGNLARRCAAILALSLSVLAARAQQPVVANEPAAQQNAASAETTTVSMADTEANLPKTEAVADSLVARGRYLAAIHIYEALQPRTAVLENKTGVACEHMRMNDAARQHFEAAIALNSKYSEAYNNLGTLAHSTGDYGRAEKMYNRANKLKPSASTWQNLGTLYFTQNRFKKGNEAYRRALALDPHILDSSAHRSIQAQAKSKSMSEIHYQLAITSAQAGNRPAALEYLRKAILSGFRDRNRLLHEKEFADLRTAPAFLQLADDMRKD